MAEKLFSVLTDDLEHCYITGSNVIAMHHVFNAANRDRSAKYGFILPLRPDWHNTSNYGVHSNRGLDLKFKRMAQTYYEENVGTRKQFISEFNMSWL